MFLSAPVAARRRRRRNPEIRLNVGYPARGTNSPSKRAVCSNGRKLQSLPRSAEPLARILRDTLRFTHSKSHSMLHTHTRQSLCIHHANTGPVNTCEPVARNRLASIPKFFRIFPSFDSRRRCSIYLYSEIYCTQI